MEKASGATADRSFLKIKNSKPLPSKQSSIQRDFSPRNMWVATSTVR